MPRKQKTTSTTSFGSPGRIGHNASAFYSTRLHAQKAQRETQPYVENPIPPGLMDTIIHASCEQMIELPDASVHLMVTSPPYNVGKEYDEDLTLEEYLAFLRGIWAETYRVLVPGGRACINVANLGRKPYIPLHTFIIRDMIELGFLMRGEIIWDKAASSTNSTAWGSWLSASNPTLRDVHEYILVFSKASFRRDRLEEAVPSEESAQSADADPGGSTIGREEFLEFTKSVWSFVTESARQVGHPAPFPIELPYRLIQLYTFAGDIVLDPFMGSGQTALAALKSGRHFVGYEINAEYVALAQQRIQESNDGRV